MINYTSFLFIIVSTKVSRPKQLDSETQIQHLKNYVFKCGIRKVWKKELEGLTPTQSISRLKKILQDLGMEGRPSLSKCEAIRERLEFEKEMESIDTRNILPSGSKRAKDVEISPKKHEASDMILSPSIVTMYRKKQQSIYPNLEIPNKMFIVNA